MNGYLQIATPMFHPDSTGAFRMPNHGGNDWNEVILDGRDVYLATKMYLSNYPEYGITNYREYQFNIGPEYT
jgi:hypothetical protein